MEYFEVFFDLSIMEYFEVFFDLSVMEYFEVFSDLSVMEYFEVFFDLSGMEYFEVIFPLSGMEYFEVMCLESIIPMKGFRCIPVDPRQSPTNLDYHDPYSAAYLPHIPHAKRWNSVENFFGKKIIFRVRCVSNV